MTIAIYFRKSTNPVFLIKILNMTGKQLKSKITEVLDEVPEAILAEVWEYLNVVRGKSEKEIRRAHNLQRILKEDKVLLEKLAQ